MKKEDTERFASSLMACYAIYRATLPAEAVGLFFRLLDKYSLEQVEGTLATYMTDTEVGQYPPKPADLVRVLDGRKDAAAEEAWADFREATRSGEMRTSNPLLAHVIKRMGGLHYLGERSSRDLDFMHDQFVALWKNAEDPERRLGIERAEHPAIARSSLALCRT